MFTHITAFGPFVTIFHVKMMFSSSVRGSNFQVSDGSLLSEGGHEYSYIYVIGDLSSRLHKLSIYC